MPCSVSRAFATYSRPLGKTNTYSIYSSLEKVPYSCVKWGFCRARHQCATTTHSMTDTMGRMHSDAQFAGSSSVPAHVEMMGFLGIGNNPMVGCTVACAVDVATALNK